ncbi:MAG: RNA-binding ATPase activator esf2 [Ramalina farinacea]|uniref:18S rRNA factor 2 n=1 Tax=Ramalina farinacea TaxID=258253 RepID=A0AA43QGX1_9LECA|nr:RNA-binding ATPase activator esf2 [Ramalina farinacea]
MAPLQRNQYLNTGSDDESDAQSDGLFDVQDSRTAGLGERRTKRRKLSHSSSGSEQGDEIAEQEVFDDHGAVITAGPLSKEAETPDPTLETSTISKIPKKSAASKKKKPGVIYLSRLPPYLKPQTLRHLFSIHGPITNLFLTPEPPATYHNRVHIHHGNRKRQYTDGWIEFAHKRHAKACVDALNGRTTAEGLGAGGMGARKKGRWYRDDVWSLKYLKGFTWSDLMQSARGEEREREEKVRVGVQREKRERQAFLTGVQSTKVEETRKRKKRKRDEAGGHGDQGQDKALDHEQKGFRQTQVQRKEPKALEQPDEVKRVLSKIF